MTNESMKEWLSLPSTKEAFKEFNQIRDGINESMTCGNTLDLHSTEATALRTAFVAGQLSGLNMILNMTIEGDEP